MTLMAYHDLHDSPLGPAPAEVPVIWTPGPKGPAAEASAAVGVLPRGEEAEGQEEGDEGE